MPRDGMMVPITQRDIAQAIGVNEATVSRALGDRGRMSKKTRDRIKRAAAEMGYHPNHAARLLAVGQSRFVGVVADTNVIHTFHDNIGPIQRHLSEAGYSMLFFIADDSLGGEQECLAQIMEHRVAGAIIIAGHNAGDIARYEQLIRAGVNFVIVYIGVDGVPVPQVVSDDYSTFRMLTQHLIDLGHRDIVMLSIPDIFPQGRRRIAGFREAMDVAGIEVAPDAIVATELGVEYGAEAMRHVLKRNRLPTAVIARHDLVAAGAMQAIIDAGLSVPGDISVVGHGNEWSGAMLKVPLTTAAVPIDEMVSIAVRKLADMCNGDPVEPGRLSLGATLIVRSSSGPVRQV